MGDLHIGFSKSDKYDISIPLNSLKQHIAVLGNSGSGKTVFIKAVIEEAIRAEIPSLLIDLHGDFASLAIDGDKKSSESKGTPGRYYDEVNSKKQVAIFTPASYRGIPISINPLIPPSNLLEYDEYVRAVESIVDNIVNTLDYNKNSITRTNVKKYLYLLLDVLWGDQFEITGMRDLANYIFNDSIYIGQASRPIIEESEKEELAKRIRNLGIGSNSLIYDIGEPLDIERIMNWHDIGKVPVNVIYLNTLRRDSDKIKIIANVIHQINNYIMYNPSNDIQLMVVMDDISDLITPPTSNSSIMASLHTLLKNGRNNGVSVLLKADTISEIDDKSIDLIDNWAFGRLMIGPETKKMEKIISPNFPSEVDDVISSIGNQRSGDFMLLAPNVYSSVQRMKTRWLVTQHSVLNEKYVERLTDNSGIRDKFPGAKKPEEITHKRKFLGEKTKESYYPKYCIKCGEQVKSVKYCINCGNKVR